MATRAIKIIVPKTTTVSIVLEAQKAISHHDPNQSDGSNVQLFRRRPMLMAVTGDAGEYFDTMARLYAVNPVPADIGTMMQQFSVPEFIAAAFTVLFANAHNESEKMGHFENKTKFSALQKRLRQAANRSFDFRQAYSILSESMGVEIAGTKFYPQLMTFFALPQSLAYTALGKLAEQSHSHAAIARRWHNVWKYNNRDAEYKDRVDEDMPELVTITPPEITDKTAMVLDIPEVSENSIRHQLRIAGMEHLMAALGIEKGNAPGWGELPEMVESLFVNGGNIKSGGKSPPSPHTIAAKIRNSYPVIDLFSGTTRSFFLGQSKLSLVGYLICRENADALTGTPVSSSPLLTASAFDMVRQETETRRGIQRGNSAKKAGQMIQNFETIVRGSQIYLKLMLDPHTDDLTKGAFVAVLNTYLGDEPTLGGQKARGKGFVNGTILTVLPDADRLLAEYEQYLIDNAAELRAGLVSGQLTTKTAVM